MIKLNPTSKDEIKKLIEKKETPEGKLGRNGKHLKFSLYLEYENLNILLFISL